MDTDADAVYVIITKTRVHNTEVGERKAFELQILWALLTQILECVILKMIMKKTYLKQVSH